MHIPQPSLPPPRVASGPVAWLRDNLFNSWLNGIISTAAIIFSAWAFYSLVTWILLAQGWQIVWNNARVLSLFRYPSELAWRPVLCVILIMGLFGLSASIAKGGVGRILRQSFYWLLGVIVFTAIIAFFFWESVRFYWLAAVVIALLGFFIGKAIPRLSKALPWMWGSIWFVCVIILAGLPFGQGMFFQGVASDLWGGILLSFFLSVTGIVVSFPLGIALALGRNSKLPIIKWFCVTYIEVIRGAPLVTWLFMASLILPLMLGGLNIPAVIRAQVAIILFSAAYMAENVRGGLQALPKGQPEAAHALGLTPWDSTMRIILPQALRAVIPAIVGLFIGLFKDTTLVTVVGLSDLFATAQKVSNQPEALGVTGGIVRELFIMMAVFFWFFCYRMSVASKQLEQELGLGTR